MQESIIIDFDAPFFSYREFNTGDYSYSLPVIPHSAAYGLVLNLAGIEIKGDKIESMCGSFKCKRNTNTPNLGIAVGFVSFDGISCLIHQYHKYTQSYSCLSPYEWEENQDGTFSVKENTKGVKSSISNLKKDYQGRKWSIGIVKREYLTNYHGVIGVRGDKFLIEKIKHGIDECFGSIPFAGDRNLMFSKISINNPEANWLSTKKIQNCKSLELSTKIDRVNSHRTVREIFYIDDKKSNKPSEFSWVNPYN
jgi:CRISPR-associated protein Cas5t